jgi:hypothetical protein
VTARARNGVLATSRLRVLAVSAVVVAAGAAGVAGLTGPGLETQLSGGPLVAPAPHGFVMTQPVGHVFTDGVETLKLDGSKAAVLRKVDLVGTDGLKIVGVALVKPGRKVGTIQAIDGWPPRDPYLRASDVMSKGIGATFTPAAQNPDGQSYELLVGLKVVGRGYLVRDGFRITYDVDGRTYSRFFPAQLAVCTTKRLEKSDGCPIPD